MNTGAGVYHDNPRDSALRTVSPFAREDINRVSSVRFADIKAIMFDFPRQGAWFNRKQYREEVDVYCLWTDL